MNSDMEVISDPVTGTQSPKVIPGAIADVTVTATNEGSLQPLADTISVLQAVSDDGDFYYNNADGITFTDGDGQSVV